MIEGVKQTDLTDCGIACVKFILNYYKIPAELYELKKRQMLKLGYYSFLDLIGIFKDHKAYK